MKLHKVFLLLAILLIYSCNNGYDKDDILPKEIKWKKEAKYDNGFYVTKVYRLNKFQIVDVGKYPENIDSNRYSVKSWDEYHKLDSEKKEEIISFFKCSDVLMENDRVIDNTFEIISSNCTYQDSVYFAGISTNKYFQYIYIIKIGNINRLIEIKVKNDFSNDIGQFF